jgi:hypothetical protein
MLVMLLPMLLPMPMPMPDVAYSVQILEIAPSRFLNDWSPTCPCTAVHYSQPGKFVLFQDFYVTLLLEGAKIAIPAILNIQ